MDKQEIWEQKQFYKLLLAPTMSLEEKMDELGDLTNESLANLLEEFTRDQEFEICGAIKAVLDDRKQDGGDPQ